MDILFIKSRERKRERRYKPAERNMVKGSWGRCVCFLKVVQCMRRGPSIAMPCVRIFYMATLTMHIKSLGSLDNLPE